MGPCGKRASGLSRPWTRAGSPVRIVASTEAGSELEARFAVKVVPTPARRDSSAPGAVRPTGPVTWPPCCPGPRAARSARRGGRQRAGLRDDRARLSEQHARALGRALDDDLQRRERPVSFEARHRDGPGRPGDGAARDVGGAQHDRGMPVAHQPRLDVCVATAHRRERGLDRGVGRHPRGAAHEARGTE